MPFRAVLCEKPISVSFVTDKENRRFFLQIAVLGRQIHLAYDASLYWRTVSYLRDNAMLGGQRKNPLIVHYSSCKFVLSI